VNEIEIVYLRSAVHPDIKLVQVGPGIEKIVKEDDSYWVYGTAEGPLAGKRVEIPADNVAAVQWKIGSAS
jgi:hypothetical protein